MTTEHTLNGTGPPRVVNLTAHPLTILLPDGGVTTVPPSGDVARVLFTRQRVGYVLGVPLYEVSKGEVEGIPPFQEGVLYVVSQLIQSACPDRHDLLCPDATLKRKDRTIVGARAFTRNAPKEDDSYIMLGSIGRTDG